ELLIKSCSYMIAAEQKARLSYDNLLRLIDDPDVRDPLKFLREREIVHFQRFGEALENVQENLDSKNYYAYNPAFDTGCLRNSKQKR
ncbi:MAG: manganese catalase family protein, partial [Eubacteriales bacterium]|nr:manganese catalase family protein [Eubacteriales bacterium]